MNNNIGVINIFDIIFRSGSLIAAICAIIVYRNSKKKDSVQWIYSMCNMFYTNELYTNIKRIMEYDYSEIRNTILIRIINREIELDEIQKKQLREIDLFLNFFDTMLNFLVEKHIKYNDIHNFFKYWFALIEKPEKGELRKYIAVYGFNNLQRYLNIKTCDYLFIKKDDKTFEKIEGEIENSLKKLGVAYIYDYNLIFNSKESGHEKIEGTVYLIKNNNSKNENLKFVFNKLDDAYGFRPSAIEKSECQRKCVRISEAQIERSSYIEIYEREHSALKLSNKKSSLRLKYNQVILPDLTENKSYYSCHNYDYENQKVPNSFLENIFYSIINHGKLKILNGKVFRKLFNKLFVKFFEEYFDVWIYD